MKPNLVSCLLASVLVFPQSSSAEIPANASCVVEQYRKYNDTLALVYEASREILKKNHSEKFQLLEPCIELMIRDTKYKRDVVEQLWSEKNKELFAGSKRLAGLGDLYINSEESLSDELKACLANKDKTHHKVWQDAIMTQWQVMGEVGNHATKIAAFEKLMWPTIPCEPKVMPNKRMQNDRQKAAAVSGA